MEYNNIDGYANKMQCKCKVCFLIFLENLDKAG